MYEMNLVDCLMIYLQKRQKLSANLTIKFLAIADYFQAFRVAETTKQRGHHAGVKMQCPQTFITL